MKWLYSGAVLFMNFPFVTWLNLDFGINGLQIDMRFGCKTQDLLDMMYNGGVVYSLASATFVHHVCTCKQKRVVQHCWCSCIKLLCKWSPDSVATDMATWQTQRSSSSLLWSRPTLRWETMKSEMLVYVALWWFLVHNLETVTDL